jgi:uncharacterized protein
MTLRPLFLSALALLFVIGTPHSAQADDAEKERLTRELLELTGSADLGKQMLDAMVLQFAGMPGVSQEYVETFMELAKPEELVELVVPLYVAALDEATLKASIAFYSSPEGRKLIEVQPQLTQESMVLGQQWGMKLAEETQRTLEARKADTPKK